MFPRRMTWKRNQEPNLTLMLTCQPVVGRNAYIISDTGRIADVNPFTPDYDSIWISIVDAAVR